MRLRFKLRWLMVAVAVAAVLMGPGYHYYGVLRDRSEHYRTMAQLQAIAAKDNFNRAKNLKYDEESRERLKKVGEWYVSRRDRYLRAARFPLIEVPREWEPWATVPYHYYNGDEIPRPDPSLLWPRNDEERKRQSEYLAAQDRRRAEEAKRARERE